MKHKVAYMGMFVALAMILSYVESLVPFFFGVPGMKLGLTNVVVLVVLYFYGPKEAFGINVIRIVLLGILFGNGFSLLYSLAGGILSFLAMLGFKRIQGLHIILVSAGGGIFHNIGQLIIAGVFVNNWNLLFYFPFLLAGGIITGGVVGLLGAIVLKHLQSIQSIQKE
ncbi:MAG: Gx transporter family protein [Lachnospiraceae bacterium]|nr:Gx transporter family protein [Lachnospiraceae bacterium]